MLDDSMAEIRSLWNSIPRLAVSDEAFAATILYEAALSGEAEAIANLNRTLTGTAPGKSEART